MKLRYLIFLSLAILLAGCSSGTANNSTTKNDSQAQVPSSGTTSIDVGSSGGITLTAALVAEHSGKDSCWQIIEGKVYDFTAFALRHPAGPDKIYKWCGKDSTAAFINVPKHDKEKLVTFLIGSVGEKMTGADLKSKTGK